MSTPSNKELAQSLYFTIALLKECNYKCNYCYPFGQNKTIGENMTESEAREIVESAIISNFNKLKFTGGEPTLVKYLDKLIEYAVDLNPEIIITIITNGTDLNRHISTFEQFRDNLRLQFSIDTTNPEHAKYGIYKILNDSVRLKLKDLQNKGIETRINTVITKKNEDQLYKMIDVASEFGTSIKLFNLFYQDQYIATDGNNIRNNNKMNASDYWRENYVDLNKFLPSLEKRCKDKINNYSKDGRYGISYGFVINSTEVLLADTTRGAYYQSETCIKQCPFFKKLCEKGFYNPHVSSNLILYPDDCYNSGLRWNLRHTTMEQKLKSIKELLTMFKDVTFVNGQIDPIEKYKLAYNKNSWNTLTEEK
jgi:MoaA/NifB/PqqE/SkfB family radical SAM enzyme